MQEATVCAAVDEQAISSCYSQGSSENETEDNLKGRSDSAAAKSGAAMHCMAPVSQQICGQSLTGKT